MKRLSVTIVVATYNNKDSLKKALEGMLSIEYPSYEIIVVNDGSVDGTREMLDVFFSGKKKITIVHIPHSGVCRARNEAIKRAKGDIVVNMDHDCIPGKGWLDNMVNGFSQGVGVVSSYGYYGGTSTAFRKDLLQKVGGYDEEYYYYREDADLSFKIMELGYQFKMVDAKYSHEHETVTPRGFREVVRYAFKRWEYHMNDVLLFKKHPKLAAKFLNVKMGCMVSPLSDFKVATGLWNRGRFSLSSPRGMTFMENKSPLHAIVIFCMGLFYVCGVKCYRLKGSLKFGKLLL